MIGTSSFLLRRKISSGGPQQYIVQVEISTQQDFYILAPGPSGIVDGLAYESQFPMELLISLGDVFAFVRIEPTRPAGLHHCEVGIVDAIISFHKVRLTSTVPPRTPA